MLLDAQRKRRLRIGLVLLALLPCAGAAAGWLAGPALARTDYTVQVAERLYREESLRLKDQTLQTEAFHVLGGNAALLFSQARETRERFRVGSALFGLWCGLAVAIKVFTIFFRRRRKEYEADQAHCVACGRCYLTCPIERLRLGMPVDIENLEFRIQNEK